MAIHEGKIMRGPNSRLILVLAFRFAPLTISFFSLLASFTIPAPYLIGTGFAIAQEHQEVICLYRRAMEETKGPIQLEDLRAVELQTAADYNDIAQLCIDCEIYDKALEVVEKALDLDPFDPVANLHAGLIHYKLEGYKEAAYHLEWALRAGGKAQKIRDVRLGEELLSGPAANPSKANLSIRNLLNEAKERAKDQETKNPALETRGKTHALHHLNINTGSEPFLGGEDPFSLGLSGSQLKQDLSSATKASGFAYPLGKQLQGTLRTHGDLSTGAIIEKGKEAVKATLKEGSRTVYPPPKAEGHKGPPYTSSSKEKEAAKGPSNKKGPPAKGAAVKEGEQEGAERFVLQPFNPGRR